MRRRPDAGRRRVRIARSVRVAGALALATTGLAMGVVHAHDGRAITARGRTTRDRPSHAAAPPSRVALRPSLDAFRGDLASLDGALARLAANARVHDVAALATAYRDARRVYKRQEAVLELLAPGGAAALNGRRQEVDDDDEAPPGTSRSVFTAIEDAVPALGRARGPTDWRGAADAADRGRTIARTLAAQAADFRLSPPLLFEAARLEIARVATLGVTGFDTPATRDGVAESATALRGVVDLLDAAAPSTAAPARAALAHAIAQLDAAPDFAGFDRLAFIAFGTEPALRAVEVARRAAEIAAVERPRAWTGVTLFAPDAFSPRTYAPEASPRPTAALVALGARLFDEPALSGDGTRTCASCHVPGRAFADGHRVAAHLGDAHAPPGHRARNTPSLLAAAYEPALFADARAVSLEDQAAVVLASRAEMGSDAARAAATLARRPAYVATFRTALGAPPSAIGLRQALAAYVRSLGRTASRADRAFRGDTLALAPAERRGARLFLGRAGCGSCHFAPLWSGATPPLFRSTDAEVLGVPAPGGQRVDPDPGRGAVDGRPEHAHAFKTPSLRNVALTAPYMHNGVFTTLEAVVAFYDRGGGVGAGLQVPNQTLPARRLHLTPRDRRDLVAFLGALTDTARDRRR